MLSTILITVLVTMVVTLFALNFATGEKKIDKAIPVLYGVTEPQFLRSMGALLGPPLCLGNVVHSLQNGDAIFPAMLRAIRAAERTVCLETYIYWSGKIGSEFAQALGERAAAGVRVHVLLDWAGCASMSHDLFEDMESKGVEVLKYHPPRWYNFSRLNTAHTGRFW